MTKREIERRINFLLSEIDMREEEIYWMSREITELEKQLSQGDYDVF